MSQARWLSFTSSEDLLAQARLEDNGEAGVVVEGVYGIWVRRRQLEVEGTVFLEVEDRESHSKNCPPGMGQ